MDTVLSQVSIMAHVVKQSTEKMKSAADLPSKGKQRLLVGKWTQAVLSFDFITVQILFIYLFILQSIHCVCTVDPVAWLTLTGELGDCHILIPRSLIHLLFRALLVFLSCVFDFRLIFDLAFLSKPRKYCFLIGDLWLRPCPPFLYLCLSDYQTFLP